MNDKNYWGDKLGVEKVKTVFLSEVTFHSVLRPSPLEINQIGRVCIRFNDHRAHLYKDVRVDFSKASLRVSPSVLSTFYHSN